MRAFLLIFFLSLVLPPQVWAVKTADQLKKEIEDIKNQKTGLAQTMSQAGNLLNNAANGVDNVIAELKRRGVNETDIRKVVNVIGIDPRTLANNMRGMARELPTNYDQFKSFRVKLENQIKALNDSKTRIEKEAEKERAILRNIDAAIAQAEKSKREREAGYNDYSRKLQLLYDICFRNIHNNVWEQAAVCATLPMSVPLHLSIMGVYKAGIEIDNGIITAQKALRFIPGLIVDVNNAKTEPYRLGINALQDQINAIDRATRDIDEAIARKKKEYLCRERDRGAMGGWVGEYFNNKNLSGSPQMVKKESQLGGFSKNWQMNSPRGSNSFYEQWVDPAYGDEAIDCGMNADNWSARWQKTLISEGGVHQFTTTGDDGVRLWVNGTKIIDDWRDHPPTTNTAVVPLPEGNIPVKVEFYDGGWGAMIEVSGVAPSGCAVRPGYIPQSHWKGEYFGNVGFQGYPFIVKDDGSGFLNFEWNNNSPNADCFLPADNFSIRWTRTAPFENKNYIFTATTDDGMRVYVDGVQKINEWRVQAPTTYTATVPMTAGNHTIKVEYYDSGWGATAKLNWQAVAAPVPPPPTVTPTPTPQPPIVRPTPPRTRRDPRPVRGRPITRASEEMIPLPPPPPPSEVRKEESAPTKLPEPSPTKLPPEEEMASGHCEKGTWSPTLRRCIEDEVLEEAVPPECPGDTHWSPTLKSCQPD